jgi:hypothetical protein
MRCYSLLFKKIMEFISTKNMTNDTAPEGKVLVQFLEPGWGGYSVEFTMGYFDNPNDYTNNAGEGWKSWDRENKINVIAYAELPEKQETELTKLKQTEFNEKYGDWYPKLGCAGAL